MAKYKRELNENGHQVSRDRHLRRFLKRILYFKPTTFIGTVVLTAVITAIVQKGMERPKNKFHHKPKNPIVQRQSGTNYVAQCSNCGRQVNVKTLSDKPEIECLTCQEPCDIIMALSDETVQER